MKRILITLLLLTLVAPAWGQNFDKGKQAFLQVDYAAALKELRPLAEQGDARAQVLLGQMYQFDMGSGIQDDGEAAKWYRLAAEQGYAEGQRRFGYLYLLGSGVQYDPAEAAKWMRLAAKQGSALALGTLGTLYRDGEGVPQDYVLAHMWFNLAGALGNKNAIFMRNYLAKSMTPDQIAEAQRLAREWTAAFEKRKKK